MPIRWEILDSSTKEEEITVILGKNILMKIIEDPNKQSLLKNDVVKKFVSIPNLCNNNIRGLIDRLIEQETYLTAPSLVKTLMQEKDKLEALQPVLNLFEQIMAPIKKAKFFKTLEESVLKEEKFEEMLLEQKDLRSDLIFRIKGKIDKKQLVEHKKEILSIGKEIEKKTGFKILVPSTLFVCPKCKVILYNQEVANKKCLSCNKEINEENVERISIDKIPDEIRNVWHSNLWLEAYFAGLLRKLGCKTWISVHVMGASGVLHEVDVLAITKSGTVLACECKTGKVSRNDVFNFCTKIGDLKAHVSILALIRELPEPETREFVKKNPAIIRLENMGKMKEVDTLTDLKHRLSLKT